MDSDISLDKNSLKDNLNSYVNVSQIPNNELLHRLQIAEKELQIQKATTKNALKVSIFIGIFCVFAVALNFSILVTLAGGIAGTDKKLNSLLENHENKIHHNEY